ncbi:MAG: hypothetical protein KIT10_02930 [Flavobacteriales bacterium]|nr:hypothetical protein [Flavobacteriales bacterium]
MERHERYDPEDIEQLLRERDFDALLEEERAYVLRHLSGRDEYQAMRGLMRSMTDTPRSDAGITADDRVREAVMDVFRREREPRWRIWLNLAATAFWPKEARVVWLRPALALGTLALLIVGTVTVVRWMGHEQGTNILAEVKQAKEETAPVADERAITQETETADTVTLTTATALEEARNESSRPVGEAPVERSRVPHATDLVGHGPGDADSGVAMFDTEVREQAKDDLAAQPATSAAASGHVVTREELEMNMSLAETKATGVTRAKQRTAEIDVPKRPHATARNLAQDEQLLDLLTAGW